ncbi:MAG: tripartite tricarboxylate transporter permease [Propionibacteriales bacterium]|nr:tripartite tricarboxylate transporter permease [Propionibacteriales bacterium]
MTEALQGLSGGFAAALTMTNLFWVIFGVVAGTTIGVLPGLGTPATIAILLPLSVNLEPATALIMMAGIYYGSKYGGSTTSILLNIPGEDASVVTAIDGYQMAKQGRAGPALGIAAIGSFVAGTVGLLGLTFLAPAVADLAVIFGPPEYTALMAVGLSMVVLLAGRSQIKAIIAGLGGFLLSTIGIDLFSGSTRFTMERIELANGVEFVALCIGLFAIAEVMVNVEAKTGRSLFQVPGRVRDLFPKRRDLVESAGAIGQGSIVGFFVGALPGAGSTVASFVSYTLAKRLSRHPEKYGKGSIAGVAAPEAANNSATAGSFVPLLTLGIPGSASTAIMLGALFVYGLQPGPRFFTENPDVVWPIIASMYIGNVVLVLLNLPMIPVFASILRIPYHILYPGIIVISVVGVYSLNTSLFDVWLLVIFGLLGYVMRKADFPTAPMVLAFVLGPLFERSLRRSLVISQGDPDIFVTRPWAVAFLVLAVLIFVVPALLRRRERAEPEPAPGEPSPNTPSQQEGEDADATDVVLDEKHEQ